MASPDRPQPHSLPPVPYARVLVVDDEPAAVRDMRRTLAAGGFQVASAHDGSDALAKALYFRPHVVVLNLMMPRMSGDECLAIMRTDPVFDGVRVILHSFYPEIDELADRAGADGFLRLPLKPGQLLSEVARLACEANKDQWNVEFTKEMNALYAAVKTEKLSNEEFHLREDAIRDRLRARYFPFFRA